METKKEKENRIAKENQIANEQMLRSSDAEQDEDTNAITAGALPQQEKEKKRTPNTIYLLKQFKGVIKKLEEQKVLKTEEITEIKTLHKKAVERWIGLTTE